MSTDTQSPKVAIILAVITLIGSLGVAIISKLPDFLSPSAEVNSISKASPSSIGNSVPTASSSSIGNSEVNSGKEDNILARENLVAQKQEILNKIKSEIDAKKRQIKGSEIQDREAAKNQSTCLVIYKSIPDCLYKLKAYEIFVDRTAERVMTAIINDDIITLDYSKNMMSMFLNKIHEEFGPFEEPVQFSIDPIHCTLNSCVSNSSDSALDKVRAQLDADLAEIELMIRSGEIEVPGNDIWRFSDS